MKKIIKAATSNDVGIVGQIDDIGNAVSTLQGQLKDVIDKLEQMDDDEFDFMFNSQNKGQHMVDTLYEAQSILEDLNNDIVDWFLASK